MTGTGTALLVLGLAVLFLALCPQLSLLLAFLAGLLAAFGPTEAQVEARSRNPRQAHAHRIR